MSYRVGDRTQISLFTTSLEDSISTEDPVRVYDAIVEAINIEELGFEINFKKVGNSSYDPKSMLKLLLYSYSYGWRSSRKIERALHHNLSFIWLLGGLKPDHKTISKFRRDNKSALQKLFKQVARLCIKLNLIEGNTLFVDGTKIRANASIKNTWTKGKCEKVLSRIDKRIEEILNECEQTDRLESSESSYVKMDKSLSENKNLKKKVENILKDLINEEVPKINSTDPASMQMKSRQGSHTSFNGQIAADEKNGLLVNVDVTGENTDLNQLSSQIEQANEVLGSSCSKVCADSGYANYEELEKVTKEDIEVIVPSRKQASGKSSEPFAKENFTYLTEDDCYICPTGEKLVFTRVNRQKKSKVYAIEKTRICLDCKYYGQCTKAKRGRKIARYLNEEFREQIREKFEEKKSQDVYALRKQKVELPFGHIKRNMKVDAFLLRGLEGVKAEMALFASSFNIVRMINLVGRQKLISALSR